MPPAQDMAIEVDKLTVQIGDQRLLDAVSLRIAPGEHIAIILPVSKNP